MSRRLSNIEPYKSQPSASEPMSGPTSDPNTFEALIERWRKEPTAYGLTNQVYENCADELAALAPHYIHKDKVRELRGKTRHNRWKDKRTNTVHCTRNCVYCELTALLGEEEE